MPSLPPVYSTLLLAQDTVGPGYGTTVAPPDGYIWVVKCITFYSPPPAAQNTVFVIDGATGCIVCGATYVIGAQPNFTTYSELGHVIGGASSLTPFSTLPDTKVMVSGYQLSTP